MIAKNKKAIFNRQAIECREGARLHAAFERLDARNGGLRARPRLSGSRCARLGRNLAAAAILGVFGFPSIGSAEAQSFRVTKISVCANHISSRSVPCQEVLPPFGGLERRRFANGRLNLKVTLLFEKEARDFLEEHESLPVRLAIWRDFRRADDDIEFGVDQSHWESNGRLYLESFERQGSLLWETFVRVSVRTATSLRLEIHDSRGMTARIGSEHAQLVLNFSR
jgi:hypothetical protein